MTSEKGLLDHISDWFRILMKRGLLGLLVGLGFVLVLLGGLMFGGSYPPPPGFWSLTIIGGVMILFSIHLGYEALKMERSQIKRTK